MGAGRQGVIGQMQLCGRVPHLPHAVPAPACGCCLQAPHAPTGNWHAPSTCQMHHLALAPSVAVQAARLTLVQILMAARGLAMNPLQSLYYVSPACFLCLLVPFCESRGVAVATVAVASPMAGAPRPPPLRPPAPLCLCLFGPSHVRRPQEHVGAALHAAHHLQSHCSV